MFKNVKLFFILSLGFINRSLSHSFLSERYFVSYYRITYDLSHVSFCCPKNTWCLREVNSVKPRPKILIRTLAKLIGKILRLWEERIKVSIDNRQKESLHNGLCSWVGPRRFFLKGEAWPILIWYPPRQRDEQPVELSRGLHEFLQWPEKAFSLLKEPNCAFTVNNLWRNYAKVALSKYCD